MARTTRKIWLSDGGQDMVEYAVMFALILVLVFGTVRLVGGNVHNSFSSVAHFFQPESD